MIESVTRKITPTNRVNFVFEQKHTELAKRTGDTEGT